MIPKHCFANNQLLGPGEIGDAYGDDREEMGLTFLQQAADEYLRDLGRNKNVRFFFSRREYSGKEVAKFLNIFRKVNCGRSVQNVSDLFFYFLTKINT